jgi:hypothetical protein
LLVQTRREGDLQTVVSAWRVYHEDVDLHSVTKPIELLRAFVDKYGIEFSIADDSRKRKFVLYENIPIAQDRTTEVFKLPQPEKRAFEWCNVFRRSKGELEIAVAYAIDVTRYAEDLRRHGVTVNLP